METWVVQTIKSPEVVAVLLTALLALIARFLRPGAHVVWGTSHGFTFMVPGQGDPPAQPFPLNTGTIFVQNMGRRVAKNIEVVLNYKPQHFQIWPALNYEAIENAERQFIIKIENLGRREFTTVEMVSANLQLPLPLRVRTSMGDAKQVTFAPMRVMPNWFIRAILLLMVVGVVTVLYLIIRFIGFAAGF